MWLGIPYLALLWFPISGYAAAAPRVSPAEVLLGIVLTTLWGVLLGRAWQGRPVAVQALALLVVVAAGGQLLFRVIVPGILGLAFAANEDARGMLDGSLALPILGFAVLNSLGLAAGLALRKACVAAWSEARHPVRTPPGDAADGPGAPSES